jgi:hypothetical protein
VLDDNGNPVVIPGVSTNTTYPAVQRSSGNYFPLQVSNGRWLATKDKFTTLKFDARRDFATRIPMYAQIGGLYREQARHGSRDGQSTWYFTGSTEELQQVLESIKSPDLSATFGPYKPVPYFSLPWLNQYFREHPEKFQEDVFSRIQTQATNDKTSRERVSGGYGMFNIKLWRLTAMLGLRYEQTRQHGRGPVNNPQAVSGAATQMLMDYVRGYGYADITSAYNDTGMNPVTGVTGQGLVQNFHVTQEQMARLANLQFGNVSEAGRRYGDWFPNVQLKFDITPNLLVRASYNKAIARQPFDRLLPGYTISTNSDGTYAVGMNNPDLKPVYFHNYDIAVELYTKRGGSMSVGYF